MFFPLDLSDTFMSSLVPFLIIHSLWEKIKIVLYNTVYEKLSQLYCASCTLDATSLLCI